MWAWLVANAGTLSVGGTVLLGTATWLFGALRRHADQRYELKKAPKTAVEIQQEIDRHARSVLSSPVLTEFAESTILAAFKRPEAQDRIETVHRTSTSIRNDIDDRVKHGFNNFDSTFALSLSKLGDQLQDGFRRQMAETHVMYMGAIDGLRETIQEFAVELRSHIAADDARREK
jgi:hypothetical protein